MWHFWPYLLWYTRHPPHPPTHPHTHAHTHLVLCVMYYARVSLLCLHQVHQTIFMIITVHSRAIGMAYRIDLVFLVKHPLDFYNSWNPGQHMTHWIISLSGNKYGNDNRQNTPTISVCLGTHESVTLMLIALAVSVMSAMSSASVLRLSSALLWVTASTGGRS